MPVWLETLFDLAAQFTGGREANGPHIVWFGFAATFWGVLTVIAYKKLKKFGTPREGLLLWAFAFGLVREVLMISVKTVEALGWIDPASLHVAFPPAEHALQNVAMVVAAAAYMRFSTQKGSTASIFMKTGIVANIVCYLACFLWWARFITANPTAKFGHTWCDILFHSVMTLLLGYAVAYLWFHSKGWLRNVVCLAFLCLLLFQFLKLPDIFTGEAYVGVFSPIRHGLYLIGIPLLGYVYVRELVEDATYAIEMDRLSSLGQAMTGLVHESRNALARSKAGLNILAHKLEDRPELFRYIEESLAAQRDVQQLFEEVRDYASPRELETVMQPLEHVVEQAWEKVETTTVDRKVKLSQNRGHIDTHCEVDAFCLEGLFRNLIENSISAADGRVAIDITYESTQLESRDALRITYRDNGPGLSLEQTRKVFDAFYTTKTRGTGLGMAIARQAVEKHGGTLHVSRPDGLGAEFVIVIPRSTAPKTNSNNMVPDMRTFLKTQ